MDANLLEAISVQDTIERNAGSFRRAALKDIIVYGRVRCAIQRPSIIPDTIEDTDGFYVIVDAYAIKCLGEDYFQENSEYSPQHLYFTKGSLIAYIKNPEKWVGKDIRLAGKSYGSMVYGTTIRRQGAKETTGITAFVFESPKKVNRKTVYPLSCNKIEELAVGSRDCKGTVLEEFMVKLTGARNNEIPYSKSLDSIIPYTGVEDYQEIPLSHPEEVTERKQVQPAAQPAQEYRQVFPTTPVAPVKPGERIDISKIDMKLVYHLDGQPKSELCDSFREDIDRCGQSRDMWISQTLGDLKGAFEDEDNAPNFWEFMSKIRTGFINNIAANYSGFVGKGSTRCKDYVNKFVSNCEDLTFAYSNGESPSEKKKKAIREGCEQLKANVAKDHSILWGNTESEIDQVPSIQDAWVFTLNAVAVCTGVSYDSLVSCYNYMKRNYDCDLSLWLEYLLYTPYLIGLVGCNLDLVDCDCIYYGVSLASGEDYFKFNEVNEIYREYMVMLNTLKSVCEGTNPVCNNYSGRGADTFVPVKLYRSATMHYDKRAAMNIENFGYPKGEDNLDCLKKVFGIKKLGVGRGIKSKVLGEDGVWFDEFRLEELKNLGVVNTLEDFIAIEGNIEQEYTIYSVLEALGKTPTGITEEQITEVVDSFEESRGFKLEVLQRDGVKLCMKRAGVLSGCAGSGKTTTSDCLTEVLKKYLKKMNIIYCTPTGKACRRLAEVVGGTVKTIHSQFKLGFGGTALIPPSHVPDQWKTDVSKNEYGTIYIMDEMAMCSTELMFNVAKNVTKNDMIYFLGDVKQLPPVGNGCPFKILMTLLPCVELGVSKRAAAGSLVNYNTTLINFMSDGLPAPLMYDDKTFIARPCSNIDIQNSVVQAFASFMNGSMNGTKYKEDDIQIITGYQKETKVTSIARLNPALQKLLRRNSPLLFVREKRNGEAKSYYKGDRIIYINSNSYDICRYIPDGSTAFKTVVTTGIVNGDVGKLVGVLKSEDIKFLDCRVSDYMEGSKLRGNLTDDAIKELFDKREERKDTLRKDSAYKGKDLYFVVIQLYDTDLCQDVLVFLRARGKDVGGTLALSGGDLDNLDLAYALTCHKMQGSQSPVVIIPLEKGSYSQFINRNMINTMITRSQGIVCLIGDIIGRGSALDSGRKCVSSTESHDLLSVLTGDIGWVTA